MEAYSESNFQKTQGSVKKVGLQGLNIINSLKIQNTVFESNRAIITRHGCHMLHTSDNESTVNSIVQKEKKRQSNRDRQLLPPPRNICFQMPRVMLLSLLHRNYYRSHEIRNRFLQFYVRPCSLLSHIENSTLNAISISKEPNVCSDRRGVL